MSTMIRKANINDANTLARLNMAVHQPHVAAQPTRYKPLTPDNPELIAIFEQRLADETFITFIAETDNQAVGYVQCVFKQTTDNVFVYSQLDFHIDQIAVLETHQGQGIGQVLMETAILTAKELHADVVTLGVVGFNEGAIRFYKRLGFTMTSHKMGMRLGDE